MKCIAALPEGHRDDVVTVEDETISDLLFLYGLVQVLLHPGHGVLPSKFMGDNKVIEQVLDGGQISPAFASQD